KRPLTLDPTSTTVEATTENNQHEKDDDNQGRVVHICLLRIKTLLWYRDRDRRSGYPARYTSAAASLGGNGVVNVSSPYGFDEPIRRAIWLRATKTNYDNGDSELFVRGIRNFVRRILYRLFCVAGELFSLAFGFLSKALGF